ncbi:MAG: outer membrane lipoprotein chaperone LolA [Gammaproteobacteria bacterium]|jgi:outer membrane lipoprotein carrier protein
MKKVILGFLTLLISSYVFANSAVQDLDKQLSSTQSFEANFVQTTQSAQFGNQITQGEMALQRPGKFRWQINKPDQQLLVSDGQKLWVYDKDLEQVIIQPVNKRLDETPALLLAGKVESIAQFFNVTKFDANKPGDWYELKALDKEGLVDKVIMNFDHGTIQSMQIYDNLGQRTNITFSQIKTNPNFPAGYFTFSAPKGVEIISE